MTKLKFLLLFVFLVGCSPSEAVIQTAIAGTQKAMPTPTSTPTLESPTSVPLPDIKTLIITQPEIDSILPGFYNTSMIIVDDSSNPATGRQTFEGAFRGRGDAGMIWISLTKFPNNAPSSGFNDYYKNVLISQGKEIALPGTIVRPKDSWAVSTKENHIIMGFSKSNLFIMIENELSKGLTPEVDIAFVSLLAQAQSSKLENAGYK